MEKSKCKVYIGSDHAAFDLKANIIKYLQSLGHEVQDQGCDSLASCDYPDFGKAVAQGVISSPGSLGIVICGSGVGISIAANKVKGIRCGLVNDGFTAKQARVRNNCNVISLGARITGFELAKNIIDTFLNSEPSAESQLFVKKLEELEESVFVK